MMSESVDAYKDNRYKPKLCVFDPASISVLDFWLLVFHSESIGEEAAHRKKVHCLPKGEKGTAEVKLVVRQVQRKGGSLCPTDRPKLFSVP